MSYLTVYPAKMMTSSPHLLRYWRVEQSIHMNPPSWLVAERSSNDSIQSLWLVVALGSSIPFRSLCLVPYCLCIVTHLRASNIDEIGSTIISLDNNRSPGCFQSVKNSDAFDSVSGCEESCGNSCYKWRHQAEMRMLDRRWIHGVSRTRILKEVSRQRMSSWFLFADCRFDLFLIS